ncbi:MAG: hypothetical protein HC805_04635 [Alkalinema sp. RL_2_19]|nr:hypothetical protein [Alkalinema sp. RL_2_19]
MPTPTNTPPSTPKPVSFDQALDLTPGQKATRSATLKSHETLNFTFQGTSGQSLKVQSKGEGILMRVLAPDGNVIDQRANRTYSWEGTLPQDGLYKIELAVVKGLKQGDFILETTLTNPAVPEPSPSPTSEPSPSPTPDPSPSPTPDPTPPDPRPSPPPTSIPDPAQTQRIIIPQGQTATVIAGQGKAQSTNRYLMRASAGQILKVGINGPASISLKYPDGSPIDDASGIKGRSLQLPRSGDYIIDVSSNAPGDFELKVDVK